MPKTFIKVKTSKVTLFTLGNRIYLKANLQPGRAPHIIIVTGPSTVPGRDLNPGHLSFEASALLTEVTRPDIPMCEVYLHFPIPMCEFYLHFPIHLPDYCLDVMVTPKRLGEWVTPIT